MSSSSKSSKMSDIDPVSSESISIEQTDMSESESLCILRSLCSSNHPTNDSALGVSHPASKEPPREKRKNEYRMQYIAVKL